MEVDANNKFNTQFFKYINISKDEKGKERIDFDLGIQDVVTAANIAYENNKDFEIVPERATQNDLYVTVNIIINGKTTSHIETNINTESSNWLSKDNGHKYKCSNEDIKVSPVTGRVYEINFKQIS